MRKPRFGKRTKAVALLGLSTLVFACVTPIGAGKRADIARWEREAAQSGHPEIRYRQILDPTLAYALGFLPFGIAGFYVGRTGLAISGFTWPISLIWLPTRAQSTAQQRNYLELKETIMALRHEKTPPAPDAPTRLHRTSVDARTAGKELRHLEKLWTAGRISEAEYLQRKQQIMDSLTEEQWEQDRPHPVPPDR